MEQGRPTLRLVTAATLEYLSMLPSPQLLFEVLPLERWLPPESREHVVGNWVRRLRQMRVLRLPFPLRRLIARCNPDYDPSLSAWPQSVREFSAIGGGNAVARRKLRRLLADRQWLKAYAWFWSCRRPATRRRLTLPLFNFLGGNRRPFLATMGVFAWSGLLHAVWYPLLPAYLLLARRDLAVLVFTSVWSGYTLLGLPVAYYQYLGRQRIRRGDAPARNGLHDRERIAGHT